MGYFVCVLVKVIDVNLFVNLFMIYDMIILFGYVCSSGIISWCSKESE